MPNRPYPHSACISDELLNAAAVVREFLSWQSCPYSPGTPIREAIDRWIEQTEALRSDLDSKHPLPPLVPCPAPVEMFALSQQQNRDKGKQAASDNTSH